VIVANLGQVEDERAAPAVSRSSNLRQPRVSA
jgi:hypothetical protein